VSGAVPAIVPAADAVAGAAPAGAAPVVAPAPSKAASALASFRAKRASVAAPAPGAPAPAADGAPVVAQVAAAPTIPADVADGAKRWAAHVKAEAARITAAAEGLSDEDKALLAGVDDVALKARILDRLKAGAPAVAPATKAAPRPAGGPPAASSVDFAAAIKDPRAMAEAKAKDPKGFADFFSSALKSAGRKSTLDGAPKRT